MKSGRPSKPTALKRLAGNPGKRPLNTQEAHPELKLPSCPDHLDGEARKEWYRIGKQLVKLGLLSTIDRAALAGYCTTWGRWVEAEEALKKSGTVVKNKDGYPILSPYLVVANHALAQMRVLLTEFGLTPASRSRIHVKAPVKQEGKLLRFINGGKEDAHAS